MPLPAYWQDRQVIIAFPHTSVMDTVMAFAGFAAVNTKGHILVKQEAFRWPFTGLLKWLGAIPVNRGNATGMVEQLARIFATRKEFQLALVPEGTRRHVDSIRTGFWRIAKAAQVPIACWFIDNQNKRTVWVGQVIPGDSLQDDLRKVYELYLAAGWQIPGLIDVVGNAASKI